MTWLRILLLSLILASTLSACGSGSDDGGSNSGGGNGGSSSAGSCEPADTDGVISCQANATSYTDFVYFDFDNSEFVDLSEAQATSSDAWDIALRRYAVKTNGGSSSDGTGQAGGALVVAQDDFYNSDGEPNHGVFTNATPASEREHLTGNLDIPDEWVSDKVVSSLAPEPVEDDSNCTPVSPPAYRIDYGWYSYSGGCLPSPHTLSANDDTGWLLRSGEGDSYSRFRATSVSFSSSNGLSATFEFLVQLSGTSGFSEGRNWQVNNVTDDELCYDFDADAEVASCSGSDWDIRLSVAGQDIALSSNSGPNGDGGAGGFGPLPWSEITTYDNGTVGPSSEPLASLYQADANSSVVDQQSWYAYNLNEMHQLWPNYRVYMINTDTGNAESALYALQVTSYYDPNSGESGHVSFRYRSVATE